MKKAEKLGMGGQKDLHKPEGLCDLLELVNLLHLIRKLSVPSNSVNVSTSGIFFFFWWRSREHSSPERCFTNRNFIREVCEMLYTPGVSPCTRVPWEICQWIPSLIKPSIPPGHPAVEPHPTKDLLKSWRTHAPWNTSLPKTEFEYSKDFPLSMCCFIRLYLYTKHLKRMQSKLSYLVDQQFPLVRIEEAMEDFIIQVDNRVCSERSLASGRSLWEDSDEELERWSCTSWVQVLPLPLPYSLTLSKLLNLSAHVSLSVEGARQQSYSWSGLHYSEHHKCSTNVSCFSWVTDKRNFHLSRYREVILAYTWVNLNFVLIKIACLWPSRCNCTSALIIREKDPWTKSTECPH